MKKYSLFLLSVLIISSCCPVEMKFDYATFKQEWDAWNTMSVLTSIGAGLYSPLLWSMYADVADYATEKNGTSSTGLIFSSGTMAQKLGGAISGSLIALLLGMAGLVSETNVLTGETVVTITNEASVRTMVWSLFSLFPAAIALVMGVLAYKFPLKK